MKKRSRKTTPEYLQKRKELQQFTRESLKSKSYKELCDLCREYGINSKGSKTSLINRILRTPTADQKHQLKKGQLDSRIPLCK